MEPKFFATPAAWRAWLAKHHDKRAELIVGFYKKDSGKASITWPESVDGALCFGWIDGIRRRIDESSYSIRFTPRRASSAWSAVNIRRAKELIEEGLMHPAGRKAFEVRREERSGTASFEQEQVEFESALKREFQSNRPAWEFFKAQIPSYRRVATRWVMSAKREETRKRRLATLIEVSERGEALPQYLRPLTPGTRRRR